MPKLSIITINRNNAEGLRKTIESVETQNFTDFEYIIIDGGSTDGSVDIIKQYADKITYWVSEPDGGVYYAINKGIKVAKGEYLHFLNSGDWYYNADVLKNVFALNRQEDFLYGNVCLYYSEKNVAFTPFLKELTLTHFFYDGICHQALFNKRTLFLDSLYNTNYKIIADIEFFVKKVFCEDCSTFCMEETICNFDMHGLSSTENQICEQEKKIMLESLFSKRVISELHALLAYRENEKTMFAKNINYIKTRPMLLKLTRRIVGVLAKLGRFLRN